MTEIVDGRITGTTDGHFPQYFVVATEAEKPTNPGVGDICRVTATTKEYTCFVVNVWSLTNSLAFDEYSNHTGTTDNVLTTTTTLGATSTEDTTNHRRRLNTGVGVGAATDYVINLPTPGSNYFIFNAKANELSAGVSGDIVIGLVDGDYTGQSGVAIFEIYESGGNMNTRAISFTSPFDQQETAVTIANNDLLTIIGKNNQITYLINGAVVATHTNNLGASSLRGMAYVLGLGAITTASIDYISVKTPR